MPPTVGETLPPLEEVELEPELLAVPPLLLLLLLEAFQVAGPLLPHPRVQTIAPATPMRPLIRRSVAG
jgi:hypothetical protein